MFQKCCVRVLPGARVSSIHPAFWEERQSMTSNHKQSGLLSTVGLLGAAALVLGAATVSNAALDTARVNCGGPAYTASNGKQWAADSGFVGGTVYAPANPQATFIGSNDPTLHQTERYGDGAEFSYIFNMAPGSYRVYLYNAPLWDGTCGAGMRQFNVSVNGTQVITDWDMQATAAECFTVDMKHFPVTTTNGVINLTFSVGSVQNPKINAIEIVPLAGSSINGALKSSNTRFPVVSSANGGLLVQSTFEGAYSLELKDLQGKRIDSKNGFGIGSQSFTNLRPGLYLLTSKSGNESVSRTISVLR